MTRLPVTTRSRDWKGGALSVLFHALAAGSALLAAEMRPPAEIEAPMVVELVLAAAEPPNPAPGLPAPAPVSPPEQVKSKPLSKAQAQPRKAAKPVAAPMPVAPSPQAAAPAPMMSEPAASEGDGGANPSSSVAATASGTGGAGGTEAGSGLPGGDARPGYDDNPLPSYPLAARRRGVEGTVSLRVSVDVAGHPRSVVVVASSGSDMLDETAQKAVRNWRFTPARRGGVAVAADIIVPIRFQLDGIAVADAR